MTSPSKMSVPNSVLSSQPDEDNLCALMADLLVTGLTTREDMLALGFTEAELAAAGAPVDRAPCCTAKDEEAEANKRSPSPPHAHALTPWTSQTTPVTSAFQLHTAPATRREVATPLGQTSQRRARPRDSLDSTTTRDGGSQRALFADGGDDAGFGAPRAREPLTEAKRVEQRRDAAQAQRFSDCLEQSKCEASPSAHRALFGATASPVKVNTALRFTVEDAMAAKETSRLLLDERTAGGDNRTFDEFVAERAMLCEDYM